MNRTAMRLDSQALILASSRVRERLQVARTERHTLRVKIRHRVRCNFDRGL